MKALIASAFLALTLATAPAFAAGDLPVDAKYRGDGAKLRLLDNPNGTNVYIRYVIKKLALDKKYGFELETVPVSNIQASINAIQADGADVGTADFIVIGRMRHAGIGVVGIGPLLSWNDDIVVPTGSAIRTMGDIKGKKVGTINKVASPWLVMRAVAKRKYGYELEKDASIYEGNIALLRGLLEQGQLDASFMFDNITPELVASGKFKLMAHMSDLVAELGQPPDSPYLLTMASTRYAAAHPQNLRAYLAAFREAVQILKTDDALWVELAPVTKTPADMAIPVRDEMRRVLLSAFKPGTEEVLRKTFDTLLETAGAKALGLPELAPGFVTSDYQ